MPFFDFAPTADVFIPQFDKVNGSFEFGPPSLVFDLALVPVDLYE